MKTIEYKSTVKVANLLKEQIIKKYGSLEEGLKVIPMRPDAFKRYLNGKHAMSINTLSKFEEKLGLTVTLQLG